MGWFVGCSTCRDLLVSGWLLLIGGGLLLVTPGYLDPYTPINGLTLIGLVLVVVGTLRLTRGQRA